MIDKEQYSLACMRVMTMENLAHAGISPGMLGKMIKAASRGEGMEKVGGGGTAALNTITGAGSKAVGAAWGILKFLTVGLPLAAGGLGFTGGYLAEQMFGPTEADVSRKRMEQRLNAYRRAIFKQKSQLQAQKAEEEDDRSKRRSPGVFVSTAV